MGELNALADRCEAATENDRELFKDAFHECFPEPARIWVTDNTGDWTEEYTEWQARQSRFYELLDAGGLLDAAMTLVPEGWRPIIDTASEEGAALVDLWALSAISPQPERRHSKAATPALALCAAALRASQ